MRFREWLNKWDLTNLKINAHFLELELTWSPVDKKAAWEMYIELLTRVSTQYLEPEHGDEETALASIHALFPITRDILKRYGADSLKFSRVAIVMLNQIIRPFTSKWHKKSLNGAFNDEYGCRAFRKDLSALQVDLRKYTQLLSDIAKVEDLTTLEKVD